MAKKKINAEEMLRLTKEVFHRSYSGDMGLWFSLFNKDSLYLCNGNPVLFGDSAIRFHFGSFDGIYKGEIVSEEYHVKPLSSTVCSVSGVVKLRNPETRIAAKTYFSIVYKLINEKPVIALQHNSYEYHRESEDGSISPLQSDSATLEFIQEIMIHQSERQRIEIPSSQGSVYVDPCSIFYIQSLDKKCEYVCTDRVISSSESLKNLSSQLPDYFLQIHRSYIVNAKYIVALRRFEAELVTGTVLPIPEHSYTKIKAELKRIMNVK